MEIYQLFPTAVGKFQYDKITEKEVNFVKGLEYKNNSGNLISIDKNVLKHTQLKKINKFLENSVKEYFQSIYAPNSQLNNYIHLSWTNITNKGQWHHKHAHPNSFISGVFYMQTTEQDRIYFHKDKFNTVDIPPTEFNMFNSETWWYPATTGSLLLFPSNLSHQVNVVEHDTPRLSLSFNTWLRGPLGTEDNATYLFCN